MIIIICFVLFFVVIAVVVFQSSMIALGDFSAYNNTEVFSVSYISVHNDSRA